MRSKLRTICAALLAVFALTAVAASSASAAPEWYIKKAGVFAKVKEAINVKQGTANWELTDKVSIFERFGVKCTSEDSGQIKPGGIASIVTIQGLRCSEVKGGERIEGPVPAVHLPWKLELYTEGTEIRTRILNGGSGTPEQEFTCKQDLRDQIGLLRREHERQDDEHPTVRFRRSDV